MRTYRKWHAIIDTVGIAGLISLFFYWRLGHPITLTDPELANIWSNLSTELLGAWAAARVIEYAIRRNDEHSRVRIRVARNMRYYLNLTTRCIEFSHVPDIELLNRERTWSRRFFNQHISCFSNDEIEDANKAYDLLDQLSRKIELLAEARNAEDDDFEKIDNLKKQAREALTRYEELAFQAESNILEETPEVP